MFSRIVITLVAFGALVVLSAPCWAEEKTHEGTVVSTADGKLVMTDKEGKNEHMHVIAETTNVTLNGKAAKVTDLKKGDAIKVTMDAGKVTAVAAMR